MMTRVSRLGRRVRPGQADDPELFGGGVDERVCTIFGSDQDAAEFDEHVLVAGMGSWRHTNEPGDGARPRRLDGGRPGGTK